MDLEINVIFLCSILFFTKTQLGDPKMYFVVDSLLREKMVADFAMAQKMCERNFAYYKWSETGRPSGDGLMLLDICLTNPKFIAHIVLNVAMELFSNQEGSERHNNALLACKLLGNGYAINKPLKSSFDTTFGPLWSQWINEDKHAFNKAIEAQGMYLHSQLNLTAPIQQTNMKTAEKTENATKTLQGSQHRLMK